MPRMKTHSRAKKVFKVTGTGKILRHQTGLRHNLSKRSKKAKLKLGHSTLVHRADHKRMERLILS